MDLSKKGNQILYFFITWVTGIFGVHWFIRKDFTKGVIYFFTAGGIVVFWMYDTINAFINIFRENPRYPLTTDEKRMERVQRLYQRSSVTKVNIEKEQKTPVPVKTVNHNSSNQIEDISAQKDIYRKAIFLNSQRNSKIKNNDQYPKYLFYNFEITNPQAYHQKMIDDNYLELSYINNSLYSLRLNELKNILETHSLPKNGKKAQLVERIVTNLSQEELDQINKKLSIYKLSDKGETFLKENSDYIALFQHQNWNITLEDYLITKRKIPFNCSFNDVAWNIFNSRNIRYSSKKQYSSLRCNYFDMSCLLEEEERYDESILFLLCTFYLDLSGVCEISNRLQDIDLYPKQALLNMNAEYLSNFFMFAPGIINRLIKLKDYYDETMLEEVYSRTNLPFTCCPDSLFKEIINDLFTSAIFEKEKYYDRLKSNFIEVVKKM